MRMILVNIIICVFIVLLGIAFSSSSSIDSDDLAAANLDWNYYDSYYPAHLLKARAAKSRFWKRTPYRKFWKRSLLDSDMNNNDADESANSQDQQQEKH